MPVTIQRREDFTLSAARRVAWSGEGVRITSAAVEAMREGRARLMSLLDDPSVVIYGVTSGYGQNAHLRFTPEERKAHGAKPASRPFATAGDPLPDRVTRGIVFARLTNFIEGHSGITPELALDVAAMLSGGPLPEVPMRGQGGAGEILSLSPLFLPLMLDRPLAEKDAVCLINGSPAATALVVDAALAWVGRLELAAEVFAYAAEAFDAPLGHYEPRLGEQWSNPHDAWALTRMSELINGGHGGARRPYQAPVSFRITPRMLGQAHLAVGLAETVSQQSLAAITDNPVLLPPDEANPLGQAISTGGYHNAQVPLVLDALTAAAANLCVLCGRQSDALLWGPTSRLPHQLGAEDGLPYIGTLGFAITGYEEEARALATATLLPGSSAGGFGQNDVASPVFLAWQKSERAAVLLEQSLASLAAVAARAFLVAERPVPAPLAALDALVRSKALLETEDDLIGPSVLELADCLRARIYQP